MCLKMRKITLFLSVIVIFSLNVIFGLDITYKSKYQLSVYYESRCGDSTLFVHEQLLPAVTLLGDYLNVDFIPFGKAESKDYGTNGFECQHGAEECHGNMVQDCALDLMKDKTTRQRVEYVDCEMQTQAGTTGDMQCVRQAGINETDVLKCITTLKGITLQMDSEYKTNNVESLAFIPTIVFEGKFNQTFQDESLTELTPILCDKLRNLPPCMEYFNRLSLFDLIATYSIDPVTGNETQSVTVRHQESEDSFSKYDFASENLVELNSVWS